MNRPAPPVADTAPALITDHVFQPRVDREYSRGLPALAPNPYLCGALSRTKHGWCRMAEAAHAETTVKRSDLAVLNQGKDRF